MTNIIEPALGSMQADYLRAMQLGSGRAADKVLQRVLDAHVQVDDIYLEIFQPTAYAIGRLWQRNEFSVAQEHLAIAIIERQMGELHSLFRPKMEKPQTLLIGCVDKELHRVGARMVADFFEEDGWTVHYLGAMVPTDHFISMARETHADLIGLASQMIYTIPAVGEFVRRLDRRGLAGIPVMVGGMAFALQPELSKSLGVRFSAGSAREAVRLAGTLFNTSLGKGPAQTSAQEQTNA